MTDAHAELRKALGAYTLGALEPSERARVDDHLEGCGSCRDELTKLAVLPGLLGRLTREEATAGFSASSEAALARALAMTGREHHREHRRLVRWRAAAVAAAAAAIALAALVVAPRLAGSGTRFTADVSGTTVAEAAVEPTEWGMTVQMEVDPVALPDREGYIVWAISDEGHRVYMASWTATDDDPVHLVASCYLAPEHLDRIEITDVEEQVLATLDA